MKNLKRALEFQKLLKKFNGVYRDCGSLHDPKTADNDIEHSYRVAMLCWMIIEEYNLKYDVSKVLKYALLHDLVEVYAGDKSLYSNYSQAKKEQDEHKALLRLKKEFPKLRSMWKTIDVYEKRQDEEANFVYLIEKLEPVFLVILSEPDHWITRNVSMQDFIDRKQRKIKNIDLPSQVFYEEIAIYLKKRKKKFFKK